MNRQTLLIVALLVSVGVNLLIAGVVLGRLGDRDRTPPPMAWTAAPLQPETQRLVRQRMRDQASEFRPLRRDMLKARQGVRAAITAEPYDPAALAAALAELRGIAARYQELIHNNVVELTAELPARERQALLRAALERGQPGRASLGRPAGQRPPAPQRKGLPERPEGPGGRR